MTRYLCRCIGESCRKTWKIEVEELAPSTFKRIVGGSMDGKMFNFNEVGKMACPHCGYKPRGYHGIRAVEGKLSTKHECGPKCLSARGPKCECSCAGANHGAGQISA